MVRVMFQKSKILINIKKIYFQFAESRQLMNSVSCKKIKKKEEKFSFT